MKLILTIFLALVIGSNAIVSYAQSTDQVQLSNTEEVAVVEDVEGLRAEFKTNTQDPESKLIKYEMILKSNIDSDRVKISWTVRGNSEIVEPNNTSKSLFITNITVAKGKTYSLSISLKPSGKGVTELIGKAEAFRVDGNYIATVRKNFATNVDSEVLPLTSEYNSAKSLYTLKNFAIASVVLAAFLGSGYLLYKRYKIWMAKP